MKAVLWIAVAGLVTGLMGLTAGCSQSQQHNADEQVKGARQEIGKAAAEVDRAAKNAGLVAEVKAALATRKGLDSSKIHVSATDGVVTLSGDIPSRAQAALAVKMAEETNGVTSVKNKLAVPVPVE